MKTYSDYIFEIEFWNSCEKDVLSKVNEGKIWDNIKGFFKKIFKPRKKKNKNVNFINNCDLNSSVVDINNITKDDISKLNLSTQYNIKNLSSYSDALLKIVDDITTDTSGFKYFKKYYIDSNNKNDFNNHKNYIYLCGELEVNSLTIIICFVGVIEINTTDIKIVNIDFNEDIKNDIFNTNQNIDIIKETILKLIKFTKHNYPDIKTVEYVYNKTNKWSSNIVKVIQNKLTYTKNKDNKNIYYIKVV